MFKQGTLLNLGLKGKNHHFDLQRGDALICRFLVYYYNYIFISDEQYIKADLHYGDAKDNFVLVQGM